MLTFPSRLPRTPTRTRTRTPHGDPQPSDRPERIPPFVLFLRQIGGSPVRLGNDVGRPRGDALGTTM